MANFQPKKIDLATINGGNRYENNSIVTADAINAPIEASAYAQLLATTQPNIDEVGNIGTPSVEIEELNGIPRFVFKNLKAKDGASIVSTELIGKNENGGNIYKQTFSDGTTSNFIVPKGEKGDAGATIKVGEVDTGEPNENAKVENVGSPSSAVLNFTIPRGEKGEQGEQGNDKFDYSQMKWVTWSTEKGAGGIDLPLEDGLYMLCIRYRTSATATSIITAMCYMYIYSSSQYCYSTPFGLTNYIRYDGATGRFTAFKQSFRQADDGEYQIIAASSTLYNAIFGYIKLGQFVLPTSL